MSATTYFAKRQQKEVCQRLYRLAIGLDMLVQSLSSGTSLQTLRDDDWVDENLIEALVLHAAVVLPFAESWRDQCLALLNQYYGTNYTVDSLRASVENV